jgi:hypothetical protein
MKDEKKKHNWVQLELWPETKTPQGGGVTNLETVRV